jgi:hypothetical protein
MTSDDQIQTIEVYRDVAIHDHQSPARIATVKVDIDHVMDQLTDTVALAAYAADPSHAPEARLLAREKAIALYAGAATAREARPQLDIERLRAVTAGLAVNRWRSRTHYCSIFDNRRPPSNPHNGAVPRETPLPPK